MSTDYTKSCNSSVELLLFASNSSTLKEALENLIENAKTSEGRSDLASKHILTQVLKSCQSPSQLSDQDLFLSIKLLRNLCAGEIRNQNLLIEQNGAMILSDLISSMGLTSGSGNEMLRMVLQVLANVSLAGESHRVDLWRQFFPLKFLDVARVRSKETCGPLCMVIYTCSEGSSERFAELVADSGLDILIEIIRTVSVAGFREDWVKLLLSKVCLEESHFWSTFSKLSLMLEVENHNDNAARIIHFGSEHAFLLRIISEIVNERVGDIVFSNDFPLRIFGILRNAVENVDFNTRGNGPLPTCLPNIDVLGYTLCILREICAASEETDALYMLVSDGLIKFLISLLRDLEPPAIIKKAMVHSEAGVGAITHKYCPYKGFRRDVVAIIGNCSYHKKHVQDEIRELDGILLLLQQCVTDEDNPFLREWGIWSVRNILEGNLENQQLVADLELQKSVDTPEIAELGLRVEVDPNTRRPKLVNSS